MLILASTTDLLQVITGSAGTVDVHASWMDNVSGAVGPGRTNTPSITTAATVIVVGAPAAGTERNVKTLHIRNRGAASNLITVSHTDGTTPVQLHSVALLPGCTLLFTSTAAPLRSLNAPEVTTSSPGLSPATTPTRSPRAPSTFTNC